MELIMEEEYGNISVGKTLRGYWKHLNIENLYPRSSGITHFKFTGSLDLPSYRIHLLALLSPTESGH
jgi:hypothetical protein